jgi:hypothetical protein
MGSGAGARNGTWPKKANFRSRAGKKGTAERKRFCSGAGVCIEWKERGPVIPPRLTAAADPANEPTFLLR